MAAVLSPTPSSLNLFRQDSDAMNTIPDPRAPSPAPTLSRNGSAASGSPHPNLSDEVATLSTKLINAINNQTSLDDTLQATRHELDVARQQAARLEQENRMHRDMLAQGKYVKMEQYSKVYGELAEERKQKSFLDREKRRIEAELENLTTALFEEANTMVAAARKDKESAERKIDQLRNQLKDSEDLLASQQEQLQDLKAVMEKMNSERDENETNTHPSTAPSTPGLAPSDKMSRLFDAATSPHGGPGGAEEVTPDHPLRFSHLINPVLRSDISSFKDFRELLKTARSSQPGSRVPSGNYSGLNLGLGSLASIAQPSNSSQPSNRSASSLNSSNPNGALAPGITSPRDSVVSTLPPLKENKFFKRALAEDVEPTLRLDIAPGLSWLARRTVLNSMSAGSLVVEPHPPVKKFYGPVFACALCGENRTGETYSRKFRFRTSEAEDAQRYPLCDYCLGRVRASCDYISFLRMVHSGHWRAETDDDIKGAWEESVRLRERMFWTRVGGGVVPAASLARDSPRSPAAPVTIAAAPAATAGGPAVGGGKDSEERRSSEDPFKPGDGAGKRVSIGGTVIEPEGSLQVQQARQSRFSEKPLPKTPPMSPPAVKDAPSDEQRGTPAEAAAAAAPASEASPELAVPGAVPAEPASIDATLAEAAPKITPEISVSETATPEAEKQQEHTIPGAFY